MVLNRSLKHHLYVMLNHLERTPRIPAVQTLKRATLLCLVLASMGYTAQAATRSTPSPQVTASSQEDTVMPVVPDDTDLYRNNFTAALWIKVKGETAHHPTVFSNKDWTSGRLVDLTTTANTGQTLDSGSNPGWAFVLQPSGAWAWNAGNGKSRFDYLPTAARQSVSDGNWHHLAFSIIWERNEARLYFDGQNVAIYSIDGLEDLSSSLPTLLEQDGQRKQHSLLGLKGLKAHASIWNQALPDQQIFSIYQQRFTRATQPTTPRVDQLRVMAWNIWHGGRHNGLHSGVNETVDIIRQGGADIICMQETYGSGPIIADRLGFYFYLRSSNLSVLSRYPLGETYDLYQSFRLGGVRVQPNESQAFDVFSLWIHYLPGWRSDSREDGATPESLIEGEWTTRAREITDILTDLKPHIAAADQTPLIVAGDFNSPSHFDWTEETIDWHNGLAVQWPVSRAMQQQGFTDTFRKTHPDPTREYSHLNWQGGAERITDRIDYIYKLGDTLHLQQSEMWNVMQNSWPSDHPTVLSTFEVK